MVFYRSIPFSVTKDFEIFDNNGQISVSYTMAKSFSRYCPFKPSPMNNPILFPFTLSVVFSFLLFLYKIFSYLSVIFFPLASFLAFYLSLLEFIFLIFILFKQKFFWFNYFFQKLYFVINTKKNCFVFFKLILMFFLTIGHRALSP